MLIVFPSDPFEVHKPDTAWIIEVEAAKAAGFEVAYLHWESLVNDKDPQAAIRHVPEGTPEKEVLYRGWMLTYKQYEQLYSALREHKNLVLVNAPDQYGGAHWIFSWYQSQELKDLTPRTDIVGKDLIEDGVDPVEVARELLESCPKGIIVKDYVKSRKHEWRDACFIPNSEEAPRVITNFLERQGEDLQGGLVFREYVKLVPLGSHPKSGMPMSLEYRIFVYEGQPVMGPMEYWPEANYPVLGRIDPPLEIPLPILSSIDSRFYTIDMARTDEGFWILMEIGDGQVSGLPNAAQARAFYEALFKASRD